jgi:hypothetical protein
MKYPMKKRTTPNMPAEALASRTTRNITRLMTAIIIAAIGLTSVPAMAAKAGKTPTAKGPVKIFLLSGQSNMTGRGNLGDLNKPTADQKATLARFVKDPKNVEKFKFLHNGPNKTHVYHGPKKVETGWTIRDDVFITLGEWPHLKRGEEGYTSYKKHGGLAPYYGGRGSRGFGPELAIGHALGDHYDETVVLVKVAFGGNSLAGNFRPPSSGGKLGDKYPLVLKAVREAIEHLPVIVPGYDKNQGYELVGLLWNQGLSDITEPHASEYESNLVHLINDLRKELKAPQMKTVVAVSGNWGWELKELKENVKLSEEKKNEIIDALRKVTKAQVAISQKAEFKGNVATAETRDFWRPREEFGGH